ncbi:hypothetical protein [Allosphingosinicella indica]|uniref:hypothetical protein n=1 Tax=Allosphingosinicella indica TaxID=941907 RepID=UPI000A15BED8|nr:hypothetical protein [Allosphingosinicella indica]
MIEESPADTARPAAPDLERQRAEGAVNMLGSFALGAIQLASGLFLVANAILIIGIVAVVVARRSWSEVPGATFLLSLGATTAVSFLLFRWSNRTIEALESRG